MKCLSMDCPAADSHRILSDLLKSLQFHVLLLQFSLNRGRTVRLSPFRFNEKNGLRENPLSFLTSAFLLTSVWHLWRGMGCSLCRACAVRNKDSRYVGLQRNQEQRFSRDITSQVCFKLNQNVQVDVNSSFRPITLILYAVKVLMNVFVNQRCFLAHLKNSETNEQVTPTNQLI